MCQDATSKIAEKLLIKPVHNQGMDFSLGKPTFGLLEWSYHGANACVS